MKSTVEPLEGNKVKVSVEVDEDEFDKAIDDAFRKIAREVRLPGFRPGKAPRKVLEARLGRGVGRAQALQDALPDFYVAAVKEHDVDVIDAPEIEITAGEEEGAVTFDAVVAVRPVVVVGGYKSLRVTIPSPNPTDEEVDEQLERLRERFAELEVVERAAEDGDIVTIDITGLQDGEAVDGLTAEDYGYEVGAGFAVAELDENLRGASAGDELEFDAAHPDPDEDGDLHFQIAVKEVKAKVLPELDDDFAGEASEFESLAELRDDLQQRAGAVKRVQAQMALRDEVSKAVADLVEDEAPEPLVNSELNARLQDFAMRLSAQGMTVEQYFAITGRTTEDVLDELRETAARGVLVDLALRTIADAEAIEIDEDDLAEEYAAVAERAGVSTDQVREQFERAEQVEAVRSDLRTRKAFEWLCDQVEIVDEDGNVIDRAALELDEDDDEGDEDAAVEAVASTEDEAASEDDE